MWALIVGGSIHQLFDADPGLNSDLEVVGAPDGSVVGDLYDGTTFSKPSAPATTLADRLAALSAIRYGHETGGVMFQASGATSPSLVASDETSQAKLTAAFVAAGAGKWPDGIPWKMADGSFVPLTSVDVEAMASKVQTFVAECYAQEARLAAVLATNLQTEITQGWPSNS